MRSEGVTVPDMSGRTVVVTGANSGIGLATAAALARAGAGVVVCGRNSAAVAAAVAEISASTGNDSVFPCVFDLSDLRSVRDGAAAILEAHARLDVLVNNAGVVLSRRRVTSGGFEATFAVNYLGPYVLTRLLLDRLVASSRGSAEPSRVVNVASTVHRLVWRGLDFDDLQSARHYSGMRAYAASKLADVLFTIELARRTKDRGVTANCLHPGTVATRYGRDGDTHGLLPLGMRLIRPFVLTPEQGARTAVYLASSPEVREVTGAYFVKGRPRPPSRAARDRRAARRLWEVSDALVREVGPLPA